VECPRCSSDVPDVSHFCHHCGNDVQSGDSERKKAYAAKPDEPVASFRLVSTIMPQGAGQRPSTYRIALGIGLFVTAVAAVLGALPVAIMVAAFALPIVYIIYLYDVNLWEDEPVPVVAAAFVATGVLAAIFTWLWRDNFGLSIQRFGETAAGPQVRDLLLMALVVPVVSELIRQIGPLYLASRPKYDDLMDGLTFGVVAGVGFACFETLVLYWAWISGGFAGPGTSAGVWVTVVLLHGFVKPLVYGTATGLAAAEFSGLGEKYDGFTPRYVAGLLQAIGANILFWGGVYLLSFVGGSGSLIGSILPVAWGLLLLGALVIRVRTVLHKSLLEAALESAGRGGSNHASGELAFCARCEMPLLAHSDFCSACGSSIRTVPKGDRSIGAPPAGVAGAAVSGGTDGPTRDGETRA